MQLVADCDGDGDGDDGICTVPIFTLQGDGGRIECCLQALRCHSFGAGGRRVCTVDNKT